MYFTYMYTKFQLSGSHDLEVKNHKVLCSIWGQLCWQTLYPLCSERLCHTHV